MDATEVLLLPLRPSLALSSMVRRVERYSVLDAKVNESRVRAAQALASTTPEQAEIVLSLLWLSIRARVVVAPSSFDEAFSRHLGDGDAVMRFTDAILTEAFDRSRLHEILRRVDELSASDASTVQSLDQARGELRQSQAEHETDVADIVAGYVVGLALGIVIGEFIHLMHG